MFGVWLDASLGDTLWLSFVGMQLSICEVHRVLGVLVKVREGIVSLRVVEAEDHHRECAYEVLLEWKFGELGGLVGSLACEQVILAVVELLLHVALKHLL